MPIDDSDPPAAREVLTPSGLNRLARDLLEDALPLVWIEGELSNCSRPASGHLYFTLKDKTAQVRCAMFKPRSTWLKFRPTEGLHVLARARVSLYEARGEFQLIVEHLEEAGEGALQREFARLKARLAAEGLFDAARKRPLPRQPATIAVVTSPTGAVWRDVCTVLARRWPMARVVLVACRVQGDGAPASIVTAFRRLERWVAELEADGRGAEAPEVTILARGGGSIEDLWSFNDERVVRAVVAHPLPVVCGVGHEVDVTLADFAADVRAPTPSAAAELVVPDRMEVAGTIASLGRRGEVAVVRRAGVQRRDLDAERRALDRLEPRAQLATSRERAGLLLDRAARVVAQRLATAQRAQERIAARLQPALPARLDRERRRIDGLGERAPRVVQLRVATAQRSLAATGAALSALGPQATLDRGYAIVRRGVDGGIVRRPADAPTGTALELALADGRLAATSEGPATTDGSAEHA
jgi:exodeoxyribonuclease VII large subunit